MSKFTPENRFQLFIDECGDHQLEKFNPNFPIFTLCGVLIPNNGLQDLEWEVKRLKKGKRPKLRQTLL